MPAESKVRNLGIVAHINAGKTTLTEQVLFATGRQRFAGAVDDGTATMDYLAEEQQRGISITAAVTCVAWKGYRLNLIDTPGHVDFTAEVERCLAVLDGVVVVLDGTKGVESQTETVWRQADARRAPRIAFVNKLDRDAGDFGAAVQSLTERLGCRPVPIAWPVQRDGALVGWVDVLAGAVRGDDGRPLEGVVDLAAARTELIEALADLDEEIMRAFVEERDVPVDRLHAALRRGTLEGQLVPVFGGTALRNRGVDALLDAVCRYLPSPLDAGPVRAPGPQGGTQTREPRREAPFCALVFKTHVDPQEGSVHLARVYSGTLSAGDRVQRAAGEEPFAVEGLWTMHAEDREPLPRAVPGDVVVIGAAVALRTGDTLFAPGHAIQLEPVQFPRPVLTMAVEPRIAEEADLLEAGAQALARDDPTLTVTSDPDTGRLLVSGMGELHLEVFQSRLARRLGGRARFGRPTVACVETVTREARASAECRAGGEGSARAVVGVRVTPASGVARVANALTQPVPEGAPVPELLCELEARLRSGLAGAFPVVDVFVELVAVDGDAAGDAGDVLFLEALAVACRKAMVAAKPRLLEPLMSYVVTTPADQLSGVLADLRSRGAALEAVDSGAAPAQVTGKIRLRRVLGYATRLRSLTRGLGNVSLRPCGFAPCDEVSESSSSAPC
ncbi:MAG: translation factor GTPase family protein [Planctomycetota bacterium]